MGTSLKSKKNRIYFLALFVCFTFFLGYSTLSIVRHLNFGSYGYDLGINSQTVWRYSTFQSPVSTLSPNPTLPKYAFHAEAVYLLISPFYWIYNSPVTLLLLQNFFLVSGAFALFLLAQQRLKNPFLSFAILISYLMFYGVQFAAWTDVHSTSFAAAFLSWLIYFLDKKRLKLAFLFLILSITTKENIALYTFLLSLVYFFFQKQKAYLYFSLISVIYLFFVFFVFFPNITEGGYFYRNEGGLVSNLNPIYLFNSQEKLQTLLYSYGSAGFLALLNPFSLLLTLAHFATFFVVASDLPGAQGIFGHYRVTLAPFLFWGVILFAQMFKKINKNFIALYVLICALFLQYHLHLPLSYLSKSWFWERPEAADNINEVLKHLPKNASVVAQNNISPHISHRDKIYTLYPTEKEGEPYLEWFGEAEYLIVDTSKNWDARHLLADNQKFAKGLQRLIDDGIIKMYKEEGTAKLFKVQRQP